jgi:L-asparaginase II
MNAPIDGEPFVAVRRGDLTESVHRVAACATDAAGRVLYAMGSIDVPVYLRSTAKPFIAAAAVREGVVERFGLTQSEVAVMAASHNGESFHIDAVRSILSKIGAGESDLLCGAHPPYHAESAAALERAGIVAGPIYNNCSGKHAGILALARAVGEQSSNYLDPAHAAERKILAMCGRISDAAVDGLPLGIDGCGIPVYAVSLRKAALSFARLASLEGLDERDARALQVVRAAMLAYPEYVGGTGDFDSVLMQAGAGSIACKGGAEAVFGAASLTRSFGLVLKVVDGGSRAVPPAACAILNELGALDDRADARVRRFANPVLYNRAGRAVGDVSVLPRAEPSSRSTRVRR